MWPCFVVQLEVLHSLARCRDFGADTPIGRDSVSIGLDPSTLLDEQYFLPPHNHA